MALENEWISRDSPIRCPSHVRDWQEWKITGKVVRTYTQSAYIRRQCIFRPSDFVTVISPVWRNNANHAECVTEDHVSSSGKRETWNHCPGMRWNLFVQVPEIFMKFKKRANFLESVLLRCNLPCTCHPLSSENAGGRLFADKKRQQHGRGDFIFWLP